MKTREEVLAVMRDEGYEPEPELCEVVADPLVRDVYAVRHGPLPGREGWPPEDGGRYDHYLVTPEGVEEVVFTDWPPTVRL